MVGYFLPHDGEGGGGVVRTTLVVVVGAALVLVVEEGLTALLGGDMLGAHNGVIVLLVWVWVRYNALRPRLCVSFLTSILFP